MAVLNVMAEITLQHGWTVYHPQSLLLTTTFYNLNSYSLNGFRPASNHRLFWIERVDRQEAEGEGSDTGQMTQLRLVCTTGAPRYNVFKAISIE